MARASGDVAVRDQTGQRPQYNWMRWLALLAVAAVLAIVSLAAVAWTSFGTLTALWPTNALALVAILRGPRDRVWAGGVCLALYASIVGAVLSGGGPLMGGAALALTNLIEIGVALWLLRVFGLLRRDLTRVGGLIAFILCTAVLAPAAGAVFAAPLVASVGLASLEQAWIDYWAADALGMILIAPLGLVLTREHLTRLTRPRDWAQATGLLAFTGLACVVLARGDADHVVLLAPLAIVAALRFGAPGAAGSVLWIAAVASAVNLLGFGSVEAGSPDLRGQLFHLQMALAVLPLATLPVAAVLAERDHAMRQALAADRARTEFLSNMSHEIRTPLNGVVGLAGLLADGAASPRDREMAGVVRSSAQTLGRLLSDVLDLARIESGDIELEAAPFHLGDSIRASTAAAGLQAGTKGLRLDLDMDPDLDGWHTGDALRLRQILGALLSNAVKFTPAGGVRLSAGLDRDRVRLTVEDTGVGFDPSEREQIFARFRQLDGSMTRRFDGAGLGLCLARQLAERMGGTLTAEGRPGAGATFTLDLPLPAAEGQAIPAVLEAMSPAASGALRVLLADDHPTNRKVVELILSQAEVDLVQVENGAEAVAAFQTGRFDLVLMDMQMPVMCGLTAVRRIRQAEAATGLDRTPILMLTANALPEHAQASFAAGADRHLTKPITAGALFAAIEEALAPEAGGEAGQAAA